MWGRYWNFTTCIRSVDLRLIERGVTSLLEKAGGHRLSYLPPLEGSLDQLVKQSSFDYSGKLWVVDLLATQEEWTIIKTYPEELLCHKVIDEERSRLSALALQLRRDAFHISVYDHEFGILLEADADGQIHLSGVLDIDFCKQFYGLTINSKEFITQFSLLDVPKSFQEAMQVNNNPEILRKEVEYKELKAQKDIDRRLLQSLKDEVFQGHTERIDKALQSVMNASDYCWHSCNLAYQVYADSDELVTNGSHLLYFHPPTNYKRPQPYTLTREQWLDILGVEPPHSN